MKVLDGGQKWHDMKILPWILTVILLAVLLWQHFAKDSNHDIIYDTIPIYDTITYDTIIPRDSVTLRYEVVHLPIASPVIDSLSMPSSIDSIKVTIPITQKHYKEKDFEAWVSGYNPNLDSIHVYPTSYYLKPNPIKKKKWVISVGANAGYNPFTRRFEPTIGVNIGWKLWEW